MPRCRITIEFDAGALHEAELMAIGLRRIYQHAKEDELFYQLGQPQVSLYYLPDPEWQPYSEPVHSLDTLPDGSLEGEVDEKEMVRQIFSLEDLG